MFYIKYTRNNSIFRTPININNRFSLRTVYFKGAYEAFAYIILEIGSYDAGIEDYGVVFFEHYENLVNNLLEDSFFDEKHNEYHLYYDPFEH